MKKILHLTLLLLAAAACQQKSNNNPAATPSGTAPAPADARPTRYLESCYATATQEGSHLDALFDDNPATLWESTPGTGPDEGIMLAFQNAEPLSALQLQVPADAPGSDKAQLQVYLNGNPLPAQPVTQRIDLQGKIVKSLYLRFVATGQEQQRASALEGSVVQLLEFPADAKLRLQGLQLWDAKGAALRIAPPAQRSGAIQASSSLAPASAYAPDKLFDGRKEFAWAEGNAANAGEGETLRIRLAAPAALSALELWNGYQRSPEHYAANARLRDFEFGPVGGPAQRYTLRDDPAGQKIDLQNTPPGTNFELKIISTYPGKRYKDLAISELLLFEGERPFVLDTDFAANTRQENRRKSQGSPLADLLDRRLKNLMDDAVVVEQSLILRADGTFVLYSTEPGTANQQIADGNWELLKAGSQATQVKIFGKWFAQQDLAAYYQGNTETQSTRIFNDVLTITADKVQGEKMLPTFWRR
jgi:hypothetical protein